MLRALLLVPVVLTMLGVIAGLHWYIADRLVLRPGLEGGLRLLGLGIIVAGFASQILQPVAERLTSPRISRHLAWPAGLWMGFGFLLLPALAISDLFMLLRDRPAIAALEAGPALTAALHTVQSAEATRAAWVVGLVGFVGLYALREGLKPPALARVDLAPDEWPARLDGYRIVQISDIHIGSLLRADFAARLVERVNALEPDLVAITGDLVDGAVDHLRDEVAPFADLRAKDGVFFVTGNHDHYSGVRSWVGRVEELGIRVLRNEHVVIERAGAPALVVAGVDDHRANMMPGEKGEDLEAAFDGVPEGLPVVLLAHDPSTFKQAWKRGPALQLSGHTHGGQIWPFALLVRLVIPFVAGIYRRGRATLYVSRGTGFWGPPMRLGAPAEVTELRLARGAVRDLAAGDRRVDRDAGRLGLSRVRSAG